MKYLINVIGILALNSAFASPCDFDRTEIYEHIYSYGSITTPRCPANAFGWGINKVSEPVKTSRNICSATCFYPTGPGSEGNTCTWELGNWGNTLTCNN